MKSLLPESISNEETLRCLTYKKIKSKMSIIQKLENSYVAILRVVVIITASLLLVGAAVFGVLSLKGMLPGAEDKIQVKAVDPKDVLAEVLPGENRPDSSTLENAPAPKEDKKNTYQAEYDKTYKVINEFVNGTSKKSIKLEKEHLFAVLDQRLAQFEEDDVKSEYIEGLAAAFQTSLSDKRIIARIEKTLTPRPHRVAAQVPRPTPEPAPAQVDADGNVIEAPAAEPEPALELEPVVEELPYKESPLVVVDEVLTAYNKMFSEKVAEATAQQGTATMEKLEAKASATTRMTVAAGLFAAFLLVIFLTIAIRIERNLRDMAVARTNG